MQTFSLSVLAFFLASVPASAATTWYVDANASAPGNGTQSSPFTRLTDAITIAVNGDTVLVAPGDYAGNLRLDETLDVRATGGPLATVIRGNAPGPVVTLIVGCDCQSPLPRLDGFTVTGVSGAAGTAAILSHDGTVANCIVTGNSGNDYYAYRCTYDGFLTASTLAGNDHGIRTDPVAVALVDHVALENAGVNWQNGGLASITDSVGAGLPASPRNVSASPAFWDPVAGDFHVRAGSPAIDAGAGALAFDASYAPRSAAACFGDGGSLDHTTACPCSNVGAPGRGCASAANADGARLDAAGDPDADGVVLTATGLPATALGVFLQHDAAGDRVFHDGVSCAGGNLIRLRVRAAIGGVSAFPDAAFASDATTSLAQRGLVTPGSGAKRWYSYFYRSAAASFCPPATANVTNGWCITW